jgi:spore maturation protein CgeB
MSRPADIVILGLALSSSWGNGHATTYRALIKGLSVRGRRVLFLERDQPWYAENRDLRHFPFCDLEFYSSLEDLQARYGSRIRSAGAAIVGSYVPEGVAVARWVLSTARGVRAFYDIDTPVTLAKLAQQSCEYLNTGLIPEFDVYLSFTGGPTLRRLETEFGAQRAEALYCSVDPDLYLPSTRPPRYDLGYMGTYSTDRQPTLERLLIEPARQLPDAKFIVAGPQYPRDIEWPANVQRTEHIAPDDHAAFYGSQRFTLNVTRADMIAAGYSPSVRLFEAAACGVPIISDVWDGIGTLLRDGEEILLAHSSADVVRYLRDISDEERLRIARAARERILAEHSGTRRAAELDDYLRKPLVREVVG